MSFSTYYLIVKSTIYIVNIRVSKLEIRLFYILVSIAYIKRL